MMNLIESTITRLARDCYGFVDAPISQSTQDIGRMLAVIDATHNLPYAIELGSLGLRIYTPGRCCSTIMYDAITDVRIVLEPEGKHRPVVTLHTSDMSWVIQERAHDNKFSELYPLHRLLRGIRRACAIQDRGGGVCAE